MKRYDKLKFLLCFYLLTIIIIIPLFYILDYLNLKIEANPIYENDKFFILIIGVLFSPMIETVLIQFLLFKSIRYSIRVYFCNINHIKLSIISIFITSLIFGFLHYFSLGYIILMFFLGLILNSVFFISELRNDTPILNTIIVHSLYNLTLILVSFFV
jgi:hypothetical protein